MIRMSSSWSACTTTMSRPALVKPIVTKRSSWLLMGSRRLAANGSPKTVVASSKSTPCLPRLLSALAGSQSNFTRASYTREERGRPRGGFEGQANT